MKTIKKIIKWYRRIWVFLFYTFYCLDVKAGRKLIGVLFSLTHSLAMKIPFKKIRKKILKNIDERNRTNLDYFLHDRKDGLTINYFGARYFSIPLLIIFMMITAFILRVISLIIGFDIINGASHIIILDIDSSIIKMKLNLRMVLDVILSVILLILVIVSYYSFSREEVYLRYFNKFDKIKNRKLIYIIGILYTFGVYLILVLWGIIKYKILRR